MSNYLSKVFKEGSEMWDNFRRDGWQNVLTGLGTARDKTQYGAFVRTAHVPDTTLTSLYHQSDIAKRIVAFKPKEMLRQGYTLSIEDNPDAATDTLKRLREMRANQKLRDGMIWGRLYGGAGVIMGIDDGQDMAEPLDEERIQKFHYLHVVDRQYLIPETWDNDPFSEHFGEPETFRVTPHGHIGATAFNAVVHRSRILIFRGSHTSDDERMRKDGWDMSVLDPVDVVLRMFDTSWQAAEHLMTDASQGVFKIQGLMSMIAGGQKNDLATRMELVDMSRSVARSLLIDADGGEEFTRQSSSFTDAHSMLDKFMLRLAAAAEMPVTILMGQSPAGMNATGESDFRWFYDTVRTDQENELRPELERLIDLLFKAKDGPTNGIVPEQWDLEFNPLWQPTPIEKQQMRKTQAEIDQIYINTGVLLPEEVATNRFRPDGYSHETQIDLDVRESLLESELEGMEEDASKPDPTDDPAFQAAQAAPLPPGMQNPAAQTPQEAPIDEPDGEEDTP